jgi:hypothetical protein
LIERTKNCFIVTTNVKTFRNNHRQTKVQRSLLFSPALRYFYMNVTTIINKALDLESGKACHGYAKTNVCGTPPVPFKRMNTGEGDRVKSQTCV